MPISTFLAGRYAAVLLLSFLLPFRSIAQSAPAWQSANGIGPAGTLAGAVTDAVGNQYVAGYFTGSTTVAGTTLTSVGGYDSYLAKLTPSGTLLWLRQIGSTTGPDVVADVVVDAAGNAYVTGNFAGHIALGGNLTLADPSNGTGANMFLIRYSSQGVAQWAQQSSNGTLPYVLGTSLGLDALGTVYLTGIYMRGLTIGSTTTTPPNGGDYTSVYLGRFAAATGCLLSLATPYHCNIPGGGSVQAPQLTVTPAGTLYLLNDFNRNVTFNTLAPLVSRGEWDILVAKYDVHGAFQWVQQYGGAQYDHIGAGTTDGAGNLYIAGSFTGPAAFGSLMIPSNGGRDAYLAKITSQGQLQWVQPGGGPGLDVWHDVMVDAAGVYVTGSIEGQAQFGALPLTSVGGFDIAVASYTVQGQVRWVQQAGSGNDDISQYVSLTPQGDLSVVGRIAKTSLFGSVSLTPTTSFSEYFSARLGTAALAARTSRPLALGLYPNPATDWVQLPGLAVGTRVQIVDMQGRLVRDAWVSRAAQVSVHGLLSGLYSLRTTDTTGHVFTSKLVVE
jgi:hypothetical protein